MKIQTLLLEINYDVEAEGFIVDLRGIDVDSNDPEDIASAEELMNRSLIMGIDALSRESVKTISDGVHNLLPDGSDTSIN